MFRDLLGKPFVWGGRGPDGYDCWGLVKAAFMAARQIEITDDLEYSDDPRDAHPGAFDDCRGCDWVPIERPEKPLDVIMFDQHGNGNATHCGVYDGKGRVIQAIKGIGVVSLPFRRMRASYLKAYRHKCLA